MNLIQYYFQYLITLNGWTLGLVYRVLDDMAI